MLYAGGGDGKIYCVRLTQPAPFAGRGPSAEDALIFKAHEYVMGCPLRVCDGCRREVIALLVTADGRRLVSGGADGSVHVWDAASRQPLKTLVTGKRIGVSSLRFSHC